MIPISVCISMKKDLMCSHFVAMMLKHVNLMDYLINKNVICNNYFLSLIALLL